MSIFVIFTYLNASYGLRNYRLICLAVLHYQYQNYILAIKSFEKIDKNVKYHFCHFHLL